ncbi:cytochrome P450 [Penicillium solitum]|uniref:cytochrome P450 n=1 Tax=Penicillium solitum TaxID=60172 RepID=UPI0032C40E42|nr:cytochrome P450 [Penicillium solitum]
MLTFHLSQILLHIIYNVWFGPLAHIPGPFLAKVSSLWIVFQCRYTRRSETLLKQHQKYGNFVRVAPNHISISDPSALEAIYGHKSGFNKGPFYEDKSIEPVLFNTRDVQIHHRKRKYLSPAFSAKNLNEYEPYMAMQIRKLMECFHRRIENSGTVQLDFNEYWDYAFGKPFGFLDKERDHLNLIAIIDARGEVLNALGHLPQILRPIMKYFFLDPFWPNGLRATSNLAAIGTQAYYGRKDQKNSRHDLLSFLFKAKDPESGGPLSEKEIIAESISFIVGGSDTTSSTMTNVVDIVSRSPEVQRQLQSELDQAFPGVMESDWVADFQTANRLPVLNAVLRETMRFKPTSATGLERVTPAGGKIIAGMFIPEGTLVSVPTLNVHHNPAVFVRPDEYDISRWLGSDSSALLDSFYPFSLGPRACIGRNFAWMEMLKTLATVFKLFIVERTRTLGTEVREGFFVKNSECNVVVKPRFGRKDRT